jgi:hypothetical protein
MLTKPFLCCFFFSLTVAAFSQTFTREELTLNPIPYYEHTFHWADLDLDGDQDLIAILPNNSSGRPISAYMNDNGVFTKNNSAFSKTVNSLTFLMGDYEGDGDIDILINDSYGANFEIGVNNGSGVFNYELTDVPYPEQRNGFIAHWQDVDGDLDLDIFYEGKFYLNEDGAYVVSLNESLNVNTYSLSWLDINNDNLTDFFYYSQDGELILYRNKEDAIFSQAQWLPAGISSHTKLLKWFDADADTDIDLLVQSPGGGIKLLRNLLLETGDLGFEIAWTFESIAGSFADVGDVNMDGHVDVIINGYVASVNKTLLYLSNTSGSIGFTSQDLGITMQTIYDFRLVDTDADSDLDLFMSCTETNDNPFTAIRRFIYKVSNTSISPLPQAPQDLSAVSGTDVVLSWDHDNQGKSVSYNIELKHNGHIVRGTLTNSAGGLLTTENLKLLSTKQIALKNLRAGHYEWRVQTVDASFRTSVYSTPASFDVDEPPAALHIDTVEFDIVTLNWSYAGASAENFIIYKKTVNEMYEELATVDSDVFTFTDEDLEPNIEYEYIIKAVNASGVYSGTSDKVRYYSGEFDQIRFEHDDVSFGGTAPICADFDNDNDYDLNTGRIFFYNDGSGEYTPEFIAQKFFDTRIARDLNNDGNIDLCVVARENENSDALTLSILINNGNKTYTETFHTAPHNQFYEIITEDFNHDGLLDIIYTVRFQFSSAPVEYHLLYQNHTGKFEDAVAWLPPVKGDWGTIHAGDFNRDGFADLLFAGHDESSTEKDVKAKVFLNVEGSAFVEIATNLPVLDDHTYERHSFLLDYNADGRLDVIAGGSGGIWIYTHTETDFVFSEPEYFYVDYTSSSLFDIVQADLNSDGIPDYLASNGYLPYLLQYDGARFIRSAYSFHSGLYRTQAGTSITDIDSDGDIDVITFATANYHDDDSYIFKNRLRAGYNPNIAPTSPMSLHAQRTEDGAVIISWANATDNSTPQALLSYNLQVKDANGKITINPETNESGSFRRILGKGNASTSTSFRINDLPAGHYTARVQTIDASFTPSAWSETTEFSVEEGPENLVATRIHLNTVQLTWTDGPGDDSKVVIERRSLNNPFTVFKELPAHTTSYTDEGLATNAEFEYRVHEIVGTSATEPTNKVTWSTYYFTIKESPVPSVTATLDIGDIDADGRMDLVAAGRIQYEGDPVQAIFKNTPSGLVRSNMDHQYKIANNFLFTDLTQDHMLDLYEYGQETVLWKNDHGVLNRSSSQLANQSYNILEQMDIDLDHDLDLLVQKNIELGRSEFTVLFNNGDQTYRTGDKRNASCQNCKSYLATADFDRDGDEDILEYGPSGSLHGYYLSLNNNGTMTANKFIDTGGGNGKVMIIDYNSDGWPDIFTTGGDGYGDAQANKLFKNLGLSASGVMQFQKVMEFPVLNSINDADWADYDHDGDMDLLLTTRFISVFTNNGNNEFTEYRIESIAIFSSIARWYDYDADGDLDVHCAAYVNTNNHFSRNSSIILENHLIENQIGLRNSPPEMPEGLKTNISGKSVSLTWQEPHDDHSTALTYDVFLYKDGSVLSTAPADPFTGLRLKTVRGRNNSNGLSLTLPIGNYTWKVQAVDNSFAGSALSMLDAFTIAPAIQKVQPGSGLPGTAITIVGTLFSAVPSNNIVKFNGVTAQVIAASATSITAIVPETATTGIITVEVEGIIGSSESFNVLAAQTITFTPIDPVILGSSSFDLVAESSSGLPVAFSTASSNVIISGNKVTPTSAGTVTITASQSGNDIFAPAEIVFRTFCINPAKPKLTQNDTTNILTSDQSGTHQWYKGGEIFAEGGNEIFFDEIGDYSVVAIASGCHSEISNILKVTALRQSIYFKDIGTKMAGDMDFELLAYATSGLPVKFTSESDKISLTGNTVKIHGPGLITIQASQPGNNVYEAANIKSKTFCISPRQPHMEYDAESGVLFSDQAEGNRWFKNNSVIVGETSSSLETKDPAAYSVQIVRDGCASERSQTKTIQTVAFSEIGTKTIGDLPFSVQASSTSGLDIDLLYSGNKIEITTKKQVTLKMPGYVTITAHANGNQDTFASANVKQSFCINPPKPTITWNEEENILSSDQRTGNQWFKNGLVLQGETGQTLLILGSGIYTVNSVIEGCTSQMSDGKTILITNTEKASYGYRIFPNPVSNFLMIQTDRSTTNHLVITVYNAKGAITHVSELNFSDDNGIAGCNVENLSPGLYFYYLTLSSQIIFSGKFAKE